MKKRKTTEEFANEINELTQGQFKLEGRYINKNIKVNIKCMSCNQTFEIIATQFLNELKCKCCGKQIDLFDRYNLHTIEDYIKHINSKTVQFEVMSENLNKIENIKVFHNICGIEQYVNTRKFIHNQICKHCDGGTPVDLCGFIKKVAKIYGTEYVILGRNKNDFNFIHTKCKTEFSMQSGIFLKTNNPCPVCDKKSKWDLKRAKKEILEKTNGEFICVGKEYITVDTPIEILHTKCYQSFDMSVNSFLKCPKCQVCEKDYSLGEKYTKDILIEFGFKVNKEYAISDCKRINTLRFDFATFDDSNDFLFLVEFDGEEHYVPIFDNNIDIMMEIKERDNIKNEYCKSSNIILIRIPFWEIDNIKKYLIKQFKKYGIDVSKKKQ